MKLGLIVYSNDPETMWNAFDLATHAQKSGDQVSVFLLGKGVEIGSSSKMEGYSKQPFKTTEQMQMFVASGGQILASRQCLNFRELGIPDLCSSATTADLYSLVKASDKVITF